MNPRIVTDISILVFFIALILLRRYLYTERFLKWLKNNWFVLGLATAGVLMILIPEELSLYQKFIIIITMFFIGYYLIYGYFTVNRKSLRTRRGIRKKWQPVVLPFISLLTFDQTYEYFITEKYHFLEIIIFIFFLGLVVFVGRVLYKETFFSDSEDNLRRSHDVPIEE
jgi:hypothetical protein